MFSHKFKLERALLLASALLIFMVPAYALGPFPSVQMVSFDGTPDGLCNGGGSYSMNVDANGNNSTSDEWSTLANGQVLDIDTETMDWADPPGLNGFGFSFGTVPLPANTVLTARIVTYSSSDPGGDPETAGTPVYLTEIQFNCTTGAQVGEIVNRALNTSSIPASNTWALALISIFLLGFGVMILKRRSS